MHLFNTLSDRAAGAKSAKIGMLTHEMVENGRDFGEIEPNISLKRPKLGERWESRGVV